MHDIFLSQAQMNTNASARFSSSSACDHKTFYQFQEQFDPRKGEMFLMLASLCCSCNRQRARKIHLLLINYLIRKITQSKITNALHMSITMFLNCPFISNYKKNKAKKRQLKLLKAHTQTHQKHKANG